MTQERIGFATPARKEDDNKRLTHEVEMLKRRVEAIENNEGNYQQYLKLKERFENS